MNDITIFQNPQFGEIRTVTLLGEPHFVLADVCAAIGLGTPSKVAERVPEDMRGMSPIHTPGGTQIMTIVTEAGLYEVIIRSDKPEAVAFRRWITSEVLPSIRKHGAYMTPAALEQAMTDPDFMIGILEGLKAEQNRRIRAETKVAELEPKAEFFDAIGSSHDAIEIGEFAKVLAAPNLGPINLFRKLRELRILMRDNKPYQDYIDRDLFRVIETPWTDPDGRIHIKFKTMILPKGQDFVRKLVSA